MRFEREIDTAQVATRPRQVADGRAELLPRRKAPRREVREEDGLDRIRSEAATVRGAVDERPQSADARRGSDDAARARREERAAKTEGRIPGDLRPHVGRVSREGKSSG